MEDTRINLSRQNVGLLLLQCKAYLTNKSCSNELCLRVCCSINRPLLKQKQLETHPHLLSARCLQSVSTFWTISLDHQPSDLLETR